MSPTEPGASEASGDPVGGSTGPTPTGPIDDEPTLRRVQRATTHVLRELDRVCGALGIAYAVYGGTAIGAVRHQGFIPWDDDVDVCMPRADYERFLELAPGAIGEDFVVMSQRSHRDYPKTFAVMGLVGTEFVPAAAADRAFPVPIGVDVFPLDRVPRDRRAFRRQSRRTWVWGRLLFLHGSATPETGLTGAVGAAASAVFHTVHGTMRGLGVSPSTLYQRWEQAARLYEDGSGRSAGGSRVLGDYSTQEPLRWSASEAELFPTSRVPFEGIMVELPRRYDAVLRRGYGDYMELPPQEQRVNHKPVRVDFGRHDPDVM
ncbi:LicD family protein [Actinomyces bowdenii]|uniref:LicD family protein n=1 Tax=Actinomyces bowdenii TaxID=131109 RepID=UPI00214C536C|nr:LicD family protein [Actinomyces bowdenii]MCR2053391.1 LicD family protein [Actinomyces bowdenii]